VARRPVADSGSCTRVQRHACKSKQAKTLLLGPQLQ
jgi:hypothetical protein